MSCSVLVATPTVAFGDLIQHTLEELGHFDVKMAYTISEALLYAGSIQCTAAILDGDLGDNEYRMLADRLIARFPDIRLVIFPPDNDMYHPSLTGISDPALLKKPFYLPDLIELMNGLFDHDQAESAVKQIAWIDPASFNQLLSNTTARVALVCAKDGAAVLAGHQPEGIEGELKGLAQRFWQREERTALVRFDRLEAGQLDCLLFLTAVLADGETVLGLVFPVSTPLSKVRAQAGPLVQALRECKVKAVFKPVEAPPAVLTEEALIADRPLAAQQEQPDIAAESVLVVEDTQPVKVFPDAVPEEEADWEGEEAVLKNFSLADMLGSIPSPDPNGSAEKFFTAPPGNGWLSELMFAGSSNLLKSEPAVAEDFAQDEESVDLDIDCPVCKEEQRLRWEQEVVEVARTSAFAESQDNEDSLENTETQESLLLTPVGSVVKQYGQPQKANPLETPEGSQSTALAGLLDAQGENDNRD